MASLNLRNINKRYDDNEVIRRRESRYRRRRVRGVRGPERLRQVDADAHDRRPRRHHGGDLTIDGVRVNDVPPAKRGIAMVFQSYALYPHMTLYDNMAFGLKLAGTRSRRSTAAVKQAAKILHIDHLLDRKPKQLSGGQRQRVAIGRAIVRKPKVFLFDEPLSNLDAALRVKMRWSSRACTTSSRPR
jgi:multiple sugar transport system ATP-binding protein